MPCYDFECLDCDEIFTITRAMSDTSIPECPLCHNNKNIKRVWKCINLGGISNKTGSTSCNTCGGGSCSSCK